MKLYFEDRYSRLREIADVNTKEEVGKAIADFLAQFNYKSYYTRSWITDSDDGKAYIKYDVGSHSEFFKLEFDSFEAAYNFHNSGQNN